MNRSETGTKKNIAIGTNMEGQPKSYELMYVGQLLEFAPRRHRINDDKSQEICTNETQFNVTEIIDALTAKARCTQCDFTIQVME